MNKQISKLKFYSFIFGFILLIQVIGMAVFFRTSNTIHSENIKKIDSLINEVGTLKNENLLLSQKLDAEENANQLNEETLKQLYLEFTTNQADQKNLNDNLNNYKTFLENERRKLAAANSLLSNQLDQQNKQIDQLKQTKETEKAFNDINQKTYSVLLLGENQKLTDTILLAVVNPEKQKTTLVSIPRDLYYEGRKINEYYQYYGIEKTSEVIQKISGIKIDKYVKFNFSSFEKLIDSLGGIDIIVDKTIIDKSYPTGNFGYKTVTFTPGPEKMSGQRALEYVRSRKTTSDFDRSLRQQKVIIALKEKIQSLGIFNNLDFFVTAFQNIQENLETDFNVLEALQTFDLYKGYQLYAGNILSNENFLYSSKSITGQSILLPKGGSYLNFQQKLLEII